MGKILCSVEPWDSILGTNRPNGTSRTWNFEETKTPEILYTITEDLVNNSDQETIFRGTTLIHLHDDLEKVEIHEIGDQKHLYIIRVLNHSFFFKNLNIGFSPISPKVLVDVKEGRAKIIIEMTTEGKYFEHPGTEFSVIERWRIKQKLPPHSVAVIAGNLKVKEIIKNNKLKLNGYGKSTFEGFCVIPEEFIEDKTLITEFKPIDNEYLYLSYNRSERLHRGFLVAKLNEYRLLDKGKISYQIANIDLSKLRSELLNLNLWRKLKLKGPKFIDKDLQTNLAQQSTVEHYSQTFVNVVTETTVDNQCVFFSEKIFKPIAFGQPFLLIGNPESLKYLKKLGYKTFDKWWDESYDNITDVYKRTEAVVKIVNDLSKKSIVELKQMREEMKPVLLHNRDVHLKQYNISHQVNGHLDVLNEIRTEWALLTEPTKLL